MEQATSPQVTPVVPAATPTPAVQDSSVQKTLAEAQVVVPAVAPAPQGMPTVQQTVPQTPAPQQVVSPDDLAKAEQRVKDTQRMAHEKAAEAAKLKTQLNTILQHPLLGPVVQKAMETPSAPVNVQEDELKAAFEAYQKAPDDLQAFQILVGTAEKRAREALTKEAEQRRVQQINAARAQKRTELVATAINQSVTEKAPDVPLELFWAMSSKAETETPMHLVTMADKLDWQIDRSIALARDVLNSRVQTAVAANQQVQQVQRSGAVVMAPGSTTSGMGTAAARPNNMVEQLRAAKARTVN